MFKKILALMPVLAAIAGFAAYQQGVLDGVIPGFSRNEIKAAGASFGNKVAGMIKGEKEPEISTADKAMSAKLQPYIDCLNKETAAFQKSFAEYSQKFPNWMNGQDAHLFSDFKLSTYNLDYGTTKKCVSGLRDAVKAGPAEPVLDKEGVVYADTLEKLMPLITDMMGYYKQQNHKDDKGARGREFDAKLRPLLATMFEASGRLDKVVSAQNLALKTNELAAMEKAYGKDFRWQNTALMLAARKTMDGFRPSFEANALPSLALVQGLEADFQKAVDEADAYVKANPDVKGRLNNKPIVFGQMHYATNMLTALKELRRDMAEKKPEDKIVQRLNAVSTSYNSLVENHNRLAQYSN